MSLSSLQIHASWRKILSHEFQQPYMKDLSHFLEMEYQSGKCIYPPAKEYFAALDATPFDQVKVVIVGQDPYHGPSQAHGLCFSVRPEISPPPSLINIFKELKEDLGISLPEHGCLAPWTEQGVLLLNAVLSVEAGKAGSHQGRGWEHFTDRIIHCLNEQREGLVFVLWGAYAQKKARFVDRQRHLVLESAHPSPLSAYRGFFGSKPFSKINDYLKSQSKAPVDWSLPSKESLLQTMRPTIHPVSETENQQSMINSSRL